MWRQIHKNCALSGTMDCGWLDVPDLQRAQTVEQTTTDAKGAPPPPRMAIFKMQLRRMRVED